MYQVEQLTIDIDGTTQTRIAFENEDISEVMRYWDSYASGINDVDPVYNTPAEFCGQSFSKAHYYRIIEK